MSYKIIGDSCLDLTKDMKKEPRFQMIPLTLQVDDIQVIDDETFDQQHFYTSFRQNHTTGKRKGQEERSGRT